MTSADLPGAWEEHAADFVAWARAPGHDSYWRFHRDQFLELVPPPGLRTLDVGCGEGRLLRDLRALGHDVVGVDASKTMVAAARDEAPDREIHLADAASLPFENGGFDCAIAFMSLQDIEDYEGAIDEAARVLAPGGRFCMAIVHPLNSSGQFRGDHPDSPFVIDGAYLEPSYYADDIGRDGLEVTMVSAHRPLEAYTEALAGAGLVIERLREPALPEEAIQVARSRRWQRLPLFLHLRSLKP
jgi:SAM-dependent methyltransferase